MTLVRDLACGSESSHTANQGSATSVSHYRRNLHGGSCERLDGIRRLDILTELLSRPTDENYQQV